MSTEEFQKLKVGDRLEIAGRTTGQPVGPLQVITVGHCDLGICVQADFEEPWMKGGEYCNYHEIDAPRISLLPMKPLNHQAP